MTKDQDPPRKAAAELYQPDRDYQRAIPIPASPYPEEPYRTPFRHDYSRLIHSPSFRRLSGKTQLFPCGEGDFFRNRLTHSLEVAQVAKSICLRLNYECKDRLGDSRLDPDLIETAALAHDIGHPPFGHNGEEALNELLLKHGGFEGNAQTLRIITRLEKKQSEYYVGDTPYPFDDDWVDHRVGLNLAYRTIAATMKYDKEIPNVIDGKLLKGYYAVDKKQIKKIKAAYASDKPFLRTIECSIMDISDDIAYSTYDLEDALKSGVIAPSDLLGVEDDVLSAVTKKVEERFERTYGKKSGITPKDVLKRVKAIFKTYFDDKINAEDFDKDPDNHPLRTIPMTSRRLANNGYFRNQLTSSLIGKRIREIDIHIPDGVESEPVFWEVRLKEDSYIDMEIIKNLIFEMLIASPAFQAYKFKGKRIVGEIFDALYNKSGEQMLPMDYRKLCAVAETDSEKVRVIADFVSGMTDKYAVGFHRRLTSGDAPPVTESF